MWIILHSLSGNELMIEGNLPSRVVGLVVEWASLHQDELKQDWKLAKEEKPLNRIEPLV